MTHNIKTYDEFLNEEYSWKSWVSGILLSLSSLMPSISSAKSAIASDNPNIKYEVIENFDESLTNIVELLNNIKLFLIFYIK